VDVGANIRRWRTRQGLTLEVLARGSGVSRAMLSDVERGNRSPTIKILAQIAVGLGCSVSALLEEPVPDAVHVERADQHPVVVDPPTGVTRQTLASPLLRRGLEAVWYTLPAGASMRRGPEAVIYQLPRRKPSGPFPPNPHGTVEHVTVLKGRIRFEARNASGSLRPGDVISYRLTDEIVFTNAGSADCRLSMLLDTQASREQP